MVTKGFKKKKSKRLSCRKKYKIERKVREHNRKVRKEAKKTPTIRSKKRKDPGVPNSAPFKEQVLQEAEAHKRRLEEEREKQREKRKKERQKGFDKKRNLDGIIKDAQKRTDEFNRKQSFVEAGAKTFTGGKSLESSLKAYYKEFRKVVEAADVVIQVLDARDPLGSRCPQVEEAVISASTKKRLVLLLNKIDLVPKENVEAWLKYLRNQFPTVAFKASTQSQNNNLGRSRLPVSAAKEDLMKSSRCLGADLLMKLLGNYCRNNDIRTSITVGIVGFPNTGKSSVINSLKRSKVCHVGNTPGVTKTMQLVQLDKHVKLLDSPGIVMAQSGTNSSTILKNCVKLETLQDPVEPVEAILKRCNCNQMMLHYNIPSFTNVSEFLALLASRMGRLKKGGVPDANKAARRVLQDWNEGKITYYTHPPEKSEGQISAQIVTEMAQEFDIDSLLNDEQDTLKGLKPISTTDIVLESSGPTQGVFEDNNNVDEEEEEEMESDEEEEESGEEEEMEDHDEDEEMSTVTVSMPGGRQSRQNSTSVALDKKKKGPTPEETLPGNLQQNRSRKQDFKRMKKERKRSDKLGGKLSDALSDAFSGLGGSGEGGDDYDFSML